MRWATGAARTGPVVAILIAAARATTNDEDGAATAVDPQAIAVHAPGLALGALRLADLAIELHLIGIVAATILTIAVVGFTLEGVLGGGQSRQNQKGNAIARKRRYEVKRIASAPQFMDITEQVEFEVKWRTRCQIAPGSLPRLRE